MVQHNTSPRGTSARMDETIVQLFLPLISTEMDNNVMETLIKIIHVLCLEPNNAHLVAKPTLNHDTLCAAPLLWNGMASIILPFLVGVTSTTYTDRSSGSSTPHPHPHPLPHHTQAVRQHICLLLVTLTHATTSTPTTASLWESIKTWLYASIEQRELTLPLLSLVNAMGLGNECIAQLTSKAIASRTSRGILSRFVRSIVTCHSTFFHQWNNINLVLLYSYCLDSCPQARQSLNIIWSRPGIGLKTVVLLLLSDTIELDHAAWKQIKHAVRPQQQSNTLQFSAISKGKMIVRYGNSKQYDMVQLLLLKSLETSILFYMNKIDFSRHQKNSGNSSSGGDSRISLSVLAGIQALVRAAVCGKVSRGAELVLCRISKTSVDAGNHIIHQLQNIPDAQMSKDSANKKQQLIHLLVDEMEDTTHLQRQAFVPRRPASRALAHHGGQVPNLRGRYNKMKKMPSKRRPFTAGVGGRSSGGSSNTSTTPGHM